MSRTRLLAVKEVDKMIPQVELLLSHVDTLRHRIRELQISRGKSSEKSDAKAIAQNQLQRSQIDFLLKAIQDDIQEIQAIGGVIKDLDMGLIDFPGLVRGQEVWLCWKRGEPRVRYWHALHEGYAQRQSLDRPGGNTFH
jgi:hypothetical protein